MQTPSERAGMGAMFAMSLPWLWGGGPELHESAKHELEAAQAEQDDVDRRVRVEVTRAASRVRAQARALSILRQREIPASKGALEAERAALRAGDFSLVSWIQSAHALREAHVDEARMRGALERAFIELELAVGHPLEGAPTEVQP
jgi:outer membrane protein TolC